MAKVTVFNPAYTPRSFFVGESGGKGGGKYTMAHHKHHHHRRRRHNPLGISGTVVKDVAFNAVGAGVSGYASGFLNQTGWMDVGATAAIALALSFVGKTVVGAAESEELMKGGLLLALIKAAKQVGVAVPGLGVYVPSYFSAPTASDAYGRATAPTIMLPAPTAGGGAKGTAGMGVPRFRTRFQTRF